MKRKFTLTIDLSIVEKAKKYAKKNSKSLSEIIESYLIDLTSDKKRNKHNFSPIVKSLRGSFKLPSEINYKDAISEGLSEKYL